MVITSKAVLHNGTRLWKSSTRLSASFVKAAHRRWSLSPFLSLLVAALRISRNDDGVHSMMMCFPFHLFPRPKGSKTCSFRVLREKRERVGASLFWFLCLVLYILLSPLSCARAARAEYQILHRLFFFLPRECFVFIPFACWLSHAFAV